MPVRLRHTFVAMLVLLGVALSPVASVAQDESAVPEASTGPVDPIFPALADLGTGADAGEICDQSGGTLLLVGGLTCKLASETVTDEWFVDAFGPDQLAFRVEALSGPVTLSEAAPDQAPVIASVTFIPQLENTGRAAKRFKRRQKGKDSAVVQTGKTKLDKADSVGFVSVQLETPFDAKKRSRDGIVVARLQVGDEIIDAAFSDRRSSLTDANGRNVNGMAVFSDDRIDFFVPDGLTDPFGVTFFVADKDGTVSGQQVRGPGGPDALIPLGTFQPAVGCAVTSVIADPAATTDGLTFALEGMSYEFVSPRIPALSGEALPTFEITLSPRGSRAAQGLDDITFSDLAAESVRLASTIDIDLLAEELAGASGYYLDENPFEIASMVGTWLPDDTYTEFDPDQALALLEEAGWIDENGDGILGDGEAMISDLGDVAAEINRITGGGPTDNPVTFGWTGCGNDAQAYSVQDACRLPASPALRDALSDILGEAPDGLQFEPGSFAVDHTGCTVLGEDGDFLGTWLLAEAFDPEVEYDDAVLEAFVGIGCEVTAEPAVDEGLRSVGSCPDSPMEIFFDDTYGFGTYFAFAGDEIDPAEVATVIELVVNSDLDGDGVSDRFDDDLDGDGIPNSVDRDDDDDLVFDGGDYAPFDPDVSTNPGAFSDLLAAMEASRN